MFRLKVKQTRYSYQDVFADDAAEAREDFITSSNGCLPPSPNPQTWRAKVISVEPLGQDNGCIENKC